MPDLNTEYLGLTLPHPFVAGASPLCDTIDGARQLEDAGASAIVLRSLYEEQLSSESMATAESLDTHAESFGEALSFLPDPVDFVLGPHEYVRHLTRVKEALGIPVIASLNGAGLGPWLDHAAIVEQAGADAIELNLYDVVACPRAKSTDIESEAIEVVREMRSRTDLPIAVKLSPFYTSLANVASHMHKAGADAFVLFNRFFEPDIDTENLAVTPHLVLSSSEELLLRLRWLAILSGTNGEAQYCVTGGVHTAVDAVKSIMCGANAVQVVSALLTHGPDRLRELRSELESWLDEHEYESVKQMLGSMNTARCPDPAAHTRGQYVRLLQTWSPQRHK